MSTHIDDQTPTASRDESGNTAIAEESTSESLQNRRGFLTKSASLLAVLGASGLVGLESVEAQRKLQLTRAQGKALQNVLDAAMKSGDMQSALQESGKRLPKEVKSILTQLNREDLKAAASLNEKLGRLRNIAADNNGGIGM